MPQLPVIPYPESPGLQPHSVTASPDMFQSLARGAERLAGGMEDVASLGFKVKNAYDDSVATNILTQAAAAKQDLQTKLADPNSAESHDPDKFEKIWNDTWTQATANAQKTPGASGLSQHAQLRLSAQLSHLKTTGDAEVKYAAMERRVHIATATNEVQENNQVRNGDEEGALGTNHYMVSHGLRSPEQGARRDIEIPQQIDYGSAVKIMAMDSLLTNGGPRVAEKALTAQDSEGKFTNFKRLTPEQRDGLLRVARVYGFNESGNFKAGLNAILANGFPSDPVALGEYQDRVKAGEAKGIITKSEAKTYLTPPKGEYMDAKEEAPLGVACRTYDPTTDRDGTKAAELGNALANPRLSPVNKAIYEEQLKNRIKGTANRTQGEIERQLKKQFTMGAFVPIPDEQAVHHLFWPDTKDAPPPFGADWQKTAPPEYKAAATALFNDTLGKLQEYFKVHGSDHNGEGPTPSEANEAVAELTKPIHMNAVAARLSQTLGTTKPAPTAPDAAIAYLKAHPEKADQFDAKYGKGASKGILGK